MAMLDNDTHVTVLVEGLDHPEGIAWGLDGYAYAGGEAGQLYRIDVDRKESVRFADTGGFILGVALDARHNLYACDVGNKAVMKVTPGGDVSAYSTGAPSEPFTTPNYPAFDAEGNLYVCDSGDWKADNGRVYRIRPGGETEVWDRRPKEFPNGQCLAPDARSLYVAMSLNPPRVDRVEIEPDGGPGVVETVIELPGTVPDGVAFDTGGNLYVSMYRPDVIYRVSPVRSRRGPGRGPRGHADRGAYQHRVLRRGPQRAPEREHRPLAHHALRDGSDRPSADVSRSRLAPRRRRLTAPRSRRHRPR